MTDSHLPIPKNFRILVEQEGRRQDGLRKVAHTALRREMALTTKYENKLRKAETNRINAIRKVDVGNVREAALVQSTQARTLETQGATMADTLRKQVETTAIAARADQATALAPIQKNIEDLRQTMWAQQGEKTQKTESGSDDKWRMGTIVAIAAIIFSYLSGHLK